MKFPIAPAALFVVSAMTVPSFAQTPKPVQGYSIGVFAKGVKGKYSKPDSIAVLGEHIYVGYGDGNDPAGLDGKGNPIVEYNKAGKVVYTFEVIGHNDGLKVNPYTHKLWALQNEDSNPNLVIIDPETREEKIYTFATPAPHGGGYDDIAFRNGKAYFSASNPANNPNTGPAIVEAKLVGSSVEVTGVFSGSAHAVDVLTGNQVLLNLQDPDSMIVTPANDVLLDSQGDSELILIHRPGLDHQAILQIPLSSPFGTPQADDTIFTTSDDGFILVSDTPANTVYAIRKQEFAPGTAFTAAVGAPDAAGNSVGFVGRLDLNYGSIAPIATGFQSPHGMAFVPTHEDDDDGGQCPAN